ncbi:hypothetical protein APSETT445_003062 [Aspergillus pseudonomiae]
MTIQSLQRLLEAGAVRDGSGKIITYRLGNTTGPDIHSYHQLFELAQRAAWVLRYQKSFQPGSVVLLHLNVHWDSIVWFWGILFAGCVPAMSTAFSNIPSQRIAHLEHLSRTLKSPRCLTSVTLLPEFGGQEVIDPIPIESLHLSSASVEELGNIHLDANSDDDAILMLTSGSTGNSKVVCLSHRQVFAAVSGKFGVVPLPRDSSFLNWVGLDHVAGLVEIHLQALYAQMDQVHVPAPNILSDPTEFITLIARHRVSRSFAPNSFLSKLRIALQIGGEAVAHDEWDISSLKYLASGGEPNVTTTCEEVSDLLARYGAPESVIVPGFGMTETCAGAIFNTTCPKYDRQQSLAFTSVGSCMAGISMRITDGPGGKPLPRGEKGYLELAGPVVFDRYFNNPTATKESFTDDGWFKTGDVGYIDSNGYLTLVGRAKETIIINGVKLNPHEVESALDEANIPGSTPSFHCCFSFFPPGADTEEICLVYLPSYSVEDSIARSRTADSIAKVVLMSTGSRPRVLPLDRSKLQKSTLGKLSRGKIKAAFERGDYKQYEDINNESIRLHRAKTRASPKDDFEQSLLQIFIQSFGISGEEFDVQTPIFDVGITSIDLIKLKKNIEVHLNLESEIPMITLMTNTTVRELSRALQGIRSGGKYDPVVILQTHGKKTPLWLIHPGVGEVLVFLNLAKFIIDRPVYALRARGFNEGEQPFSTIEEVVTTYHTAIKLRQPEGPYALAGYSYGSMLAFEIGKTLENQGDEVRFLGSFNLPPHIKTRMRQLDWKECLLHLSYFLDLMTEERARELARELTDATREAALDRVLGSADMARFTELALTGAGLVKWANLAFALQSMAVDYDPAGSIGGMDVFYCVPLAVVASSKKQWLEEHLSKWKDFTRSEPRFHDVGGAHYTMLGPEHVFRFQKTLRNALNARGI